jgi:hypothetical protein
MQTTLIIVAVISVAAVIVMGLLVFRVYRYERGRSEARASMLVQLTGAEEPFEAAPAPADPWLSDTPLGDTPLDDTPSTVSTVSGLFSAPVAESPWPRRVSIAGGLAVLFSVVVFVASHAGTRGNGGAPASAATAHEHPLELMSLRHTQQSDTLTITGLVQNPRGSAPVSQIIATAFLFDASGTFLTSGRAPLDFTTLRPGDESAFVINIPVTGAVARYRISFRDAGGRVVAHVDRRNATPLARNE